MSNPIYDMMHGNQNVNGIIQQFNQFRNAFKGDPRQQIQQLLNSGRITQAQYDEAVRKAQMLQRMMGGK